MSILQPSRRGFLGGLIAGLAAPAIVKAQNIMPVRTPLILRQPIVVPQTVVPQRRWMVTEIRRSFRPDQLVTAEVSLVEAFGVDDAPGKVIHRDSCYATECREHVDVRQLRSLDDRILTVRGLVSREASFSCDPAFACGLMPGDVVTLTGSEP